MGSPGKPENHGIAAPDIGEAEAVNELVDENPLLIDSDGIMLVPSTFTGW